ncbi:MAG: hypothetical protein NVSMB18_35060 [Acetobacteraceae bacterium]
MTRWLDRIGHAAALALPLVLLHGRGLAEALITAIALLFLLRSAQTRDWSWLRRAWMPVALAWWLWLVLCTALAQSASGHAEILQAAFLVRFLLLAAALDHWLLRPAWARLWLVRLLRWSALYIAAQSALQFTTGRNLFGWPRAPDGELTGPYKNPRAGAPLARLLFPALLPWARTPIAGILLFAAAVLVMIMIGQRMPLLLTFLGLLITALLLPRLRAPVLLAALAALLLLAALPTLSPQAAARLETKFTAQITHFPDSHYGQIAARSLAIARAHPLTGAGFDGFRRLCVDPAYCQGWHGDDGGAAAICVQHPHNFYLQALTEAGLPGLILFAALALAWLQSLLQGLWTRPDTPRPDPLRVGLFVAALLHLIPIASTTDFVSMPLAGWFFLTIGLGLAEARAARPPVPLPVPTPYIPTRNAQPEAP